MSLIEFSQTVRTLESEHELFDHASIFAKTIGFEHCSYLIKIPLPVSRPQVLTFGAYPIEWQRDGKSTEYAHINPLATYCSTVAQPFPWSDEIFNAVPRPPDSVARYGWSHPVRDVTGTLGITSVWLRDKEISTSELNEIQGKLVWFSQLLHTGMSRILLPKLTPQKNAQLTEREKDVLRWTAQGKTSNEIGRILIVAERTVNFHINNAITKLGASNRTQAAVTAALIGML